MRSLGAPAQARPAGRCPARRPQQPGRGCSAGRATPIAAGEPGRARVPLRSAHRLLASASNGSAAPAPGNGANSANGADATVLVWYKADLRVDDHPGLHGARRAAAALPVFCFDPQQHRHLLRTPNGVEGLVGAVRALQSQLEGLGSRLLVLEGAAEDLLPQLAEQHGASAVVTEAEVEHGWQEAVAEVAARLPPGCQLRTWQASLFPADAYSSDFRSFKQRRGSAAQPLAAPEALPAAPGAAEPGNPAGEWVQRWRRLLQEADAEHWPQQLAQPGPSEPLLRLGQSDLSRRLAEGGEPAALQALREYLAAAAPGSQPSPELLAAVLAGESRAVPSGSFPAIFAQALALGTLSRRRVWAEAAAQLAGPNARRQLPAGCRPPAAACAAAEASDFHWHMARERCGRPGQSGLAPRHWRWRGFLTDYFTAGPEPEERDPAKPAVLLVHGFGAFGEQWRGQLQALAAAGHTVYAPTMPGYGRAEKPALAYSQHLWAGFLRDFTLDVIKRPVVVAGNSIGGFISASLAADNPDLVQGLVLFNSAGLLKEGYQPAPELPAAAAVAGSSSGGGGPPGFLADGVSSALLAYLEATVGRTLKRVYPTNPEAADAWLTAEIRRAAADPGAKGVFRSVFYLPKPRPLNHLVADLFGKPTLILQGAKDPLQNAVGRARAMDRLCPNVEVVLLEAGHCPFDEAPELCNPPLLRFLASVAAAQPAAQPAAAA